MDIKIARVGQEDLPLLADINRLAYSNETISKFAWKNWPDEPNMKEFYNQRVAERFQTNDTSMFKAVDPSSGEIYGFIACTLEHAAEEAPAGETTASPSSKIIQQLPPYMNLDFVMASGGVMEQMKQLGMKNEKSHYYISAFAVHPQYHGRGIGSQLLDHCLRMADEAGRRTWLMAFPMSHSLYLRSRFVDVDHRDVDLNKWDGYRFRGYGLYRQYLMMREPAKQSG